MTPEEIKNIQVGDIVFDPNGPYPYVLCKVTDTPETIKREYENDPEGYKRDDIAEDEFWFTRIADRVESYGYLRFYEHWDKIPD